MFPNGTPASVQRACITSVPIFPLPLNVSVSPSSLTVYVMDLLVLSSTDVIPPAMFMAKASIGTITSTIATANIILKNFRFVLITIPLASLFLNI